MLVYAVLKGEIYMQITSTKNSLFAILVNNEELANNIFSGEKFDNYNVDTMKELEKKYISRLKQVKVKFKLFSISVFLGRDDLIKKSALNLEYEQQRLSSAQNNLEAFESKLAYLILSGKITTPGELGFSQKYVEKLLAKKDKQLKNSTVEYYYNELTQRTSKIINGNYIMLPYTPDVVKNAVEKKKSEDTSGNIRYRRLF